MGVLRKGRTGEFLCAIGVGLFGLALVAGAVQSLRVERRLPAVDLFESGSKTYINKLLAQENYEGAIEELYMQSLMLPFDTATREDLGNLLAKRKRPEEAQTQFIELLRLRPDYAEGYKSLGSTYLESDQPELAASCFARAISLKPEFPAALNALGVALARLGDLPQAEKCFAKAVEISPEFADAKMYLFTARLG